MSFRSPSPPRPRRGTRGGYRIPGMTHGSAPEPEPTSTAGTAGADTPQDSHAQGPAEETGARAGFAAGYAEGLAQGRAEAAAEMQPAIDSLRRLREQLEAPLVSLERQLAELVTDGALHLARHVLRAELAASPDKVAAVVTEVLAEAGAARSAGQSLRMRVSPDDLACVRNALGETDVALEPDGDIARGGAEVVLAADGTDTVHRIEWDARLETRWSEIAACLALPGD